MKTKPGTSGRARFPQMARGAARELAAFTGLLLLAIGLAAIWPHPIAIALACLLAVVWALALHFYRDPERTPDSVELGAVLSPADGRIVEIQREPEERFMHGEALKISIFMSVLDVHVNRAPLQGSVVLVEHVPGRFLRAHLPEAALLNEHNWIGLEGPHGRLLVNQIAGIMARRIVCWASPGQTLTRGERLGMIKLGSRVEVYLPPTATAAIKKGDQVYAGKTVIARLEPD